MEYKRQGYALSTAVVGGMMEPNHILPPDSSSGGAGALNLNQTWLVDRMMDQTDQTHLKVTWIMEGIVLAGIGGLSVVGKVYQFALTLMGW